MTNENQSTVDTVWLLRANATDCDQAGDIGARAQASLDRRAADEIEWLRRYVMLLETVKGAFEEQAEGWRKRLLELQGHV